MEATEAPHPTTKPKHYFQKRQFIVKMVIVVAFNLFVVKMLSLTFLFWSKFKLVMLSTFFVLRTSEFINEDSPRQRDLYFNHQKSWRTSAKVASLLKARAVLLNISSTSDGRIQPSSASNLLLTSFKTSASLDPSMKMIVSLNLTSKQFLPVKTNTNYFLNLVGNCQGPKGNRTGLKRMKLRKGDWCYVPSASRLKQAIARHIICTIWTVPFTLKSWCVSWYTALRRQHKWAVKCCNNMESWLQR